MAVTAASAEFLIEAASAGASFARTLTIGHQGLRIGPDHIWRLLARHGVEPSLSRREFRRELGWSPWADAFFRLLGATSVDAIDASSFEGASVVHDLNEPVPTELHERFDLVFDGGSIEHIFNAPIALKSYMEMAAIGGDLVIQTHANNYFGHGFYQFSSEFFFRTLSEANGYTLRRMLVCEEDTDALGRFRGRVLYPTHSRRYEVLDPEAVRERVTLVNSHPITILVHATRIAKAPIFALPPQQSDYAASWSADSARDAIDPSAVTARPARNLVRRSIPRPAREWFVKDVLLRLERDVVQRIAPLLDPLAHRRARRKRSLQNQRFFRRVPR